MESMGGWTGGPGVVGEKILQRWSPPSETRQHLNMCPVPHHLTSGGRNLGLRFSSVYGRYFGNKFDETIGLVGSRICKVPQKMSARGTRVS